jgi:hypothetical protein
MEVREGGRGRWTKQGRVGRDRDPKKFSLSDEVKGIVQPKLHAYRLLVRVTRWRDWPLILRHIHVRLCCWLVRRLLLLFCRCRHSGWLARWLADWNVPGLALPRW